MKSHVWPFDCLFHFQGSLSPLPVHWKQEKDNQKTHSDQQKDVYIWNVNSDLKSAKGEHLSGSIAKSQQSPSKLTQLPWEKHKFPKSHWFGHEEPNTMKDLFPVQLKT